MTEERENPAGPPPPPPDPHEAPTVAVAPTVLFGEIAIAEGWLTPSQLEGALRQQEEETYPVEIGEILVRKKLITPDQLHRILEIQSGRLGEAHGTVLTLEESLFGKTVLQLGLATEAQVREALREQARRRKKGERVRLGKVMVEAGTLTEALVRTVLRTQRKEVLFCPTCYVQYNIVGFEPGRAFPCRSCGGELNIPDPDEDAPVDSGSVVSRKTRLTPQTGGGTYPDYTTRPSYSRSGEIEGQFFGDYRILKKVARGGMGIVYQAVQTGLDRVVALKVLSSGAGASGEELRRFHLEASAAASLNHPHIVPIHEVGVIDGLHYFTMDFIKGRTLSRMIRKGGLPIREALLTTKKVADALSYAHSQSIVHRDIKPANIIVDQFDNPRITDFGIVKDLLSDSKVTRTGELIGTPSYMSPEQAEGEEGIDGRTDVYSLGAVLYELLTSRPPFRGENSIETLMKVVRDDPVSPRSLNPSIHRDVETICLKCLEKKPEKRYATAGDLKEDIERYLNGQAIVARPIGLWEHLWRKILRNKAIALTAAAASLAVILIAGLAVTAGVRAERAHREGVLSHIANGRDLMGAGELLKARLEFEKARALDPECREAIEGIEDAERGLRRRRDRLIDEGDLLLEEGKLKEAERKYHEALRIDGHSEEARAGADRVKLALVEAGKVERLRRESQGLLRRGRDRAAEARRAPPEEAGAIYLDAIILTRQALAKDPTPDLDASEVRPALGDLLLEYAQVLLDGGSFEMSTFLVSEAELLGIEPGRVEHLRREGDRKRKEHEGYTELMRLGRERLAEGDFDGAARSAMQALEVAETEEARETLREAIYRQGIAEGDAQAAAGSWEAALRGYEAALENAGEDARQVAEAKLARAREEFCAPLITEADGLWSQGKTIEAAEVLQEILDVDPSNRVARSMKADLVRTEEAPEGKVYVRGGRFSLASDLSGRKRILGSFYIDRYEVTNRQYAEFVGANGYEKEEFWDAEGWEQIGKFVSKDGRRGPLGWRSGTYPSGTADRPVSGVCFYEARAYARWRGERLPFEWEWEKAASGNEDDRRKYPWGETWLPSLANLNSDRSCKVGEERRDVSPSGIRDLGGNVSEWTVGEEEMPVVKGGSYRFPLERYVRCSFRGLPSPLFRSEGTGFRCAREISSEEKP